MPVLLCPTCGKKLRAPDSAAGKRVQCPCGAKLKVPTQDEGASAEAPVSLDQLSHGETMSSGVACPQCASPLPDGAVICTNCGFSLAEGTRLETDTGDAAAPYTPPRGTRVRSTGPDPSGAASKWKTFALLAILGLGCYAGYRWIQSLRSFDPAKYAQEKLASIKPGMSLSQVVANMGEPQEVYRYGTDQGTDANLGFGPFKAEWSQDFLNAYKGRLSSGFFLVYRFTFAGDHHVMFDERGIMMDVEEAPNLLKG